MFRARAIIIRKQHIALIKRQRNGEEYYVLPGGGMEPGETPEQTAIRESREELGLTIAIERLLAKITFRGREQYYFLARATGGHFGTGLGPEMTGKYPPERGTYTPVWVPLHEVGRINLFPPSIAELMRTASERGWPENVVEIRIDE
ncbi:MAG: NUDIX domain-containing protein [Anaerolineales bacterium]|nr:NUDIX domain-containing protein [Anaerolineales bacterium]MDW8276825.1 NUDIX domain-containing protein [Anaerolineales bacterium]